MPPQKGKARWAERAYEEDSKTMSKFNDIVKQAQKLVNNESTICPHCGQVNRLPLKYSVNKLNFTFS